MYSCVSCGGTKFHATVYHSVDLNGNLVELSDDTELRCVTCHNSYLLKELRNESVRVDEPKTVADVVGGEEKSGGKKKTSG